MNATTKITKTTEAPTEVSRDIRRAVDVQSNTITTIPGRRFPKHLAPLLEAYNGLAYGISYNGLSGGVTWLFYKADEYDEDAPRPATLPSIVHRSAVAGTAPVLYFMIPQETDFLNDDMGILLSRTSPILPSDQCAGSVVFIPNADEDLVGSDSIDSDAIIEAVIGYGRAAGAAVHARAAKKAQEAEARRADEVEARKAKAIAAAKARLPNMVPLVEAYPGLEFDLRNDGLNGGDKWVFVKVWHHSDVPPPTTLPSIVDGEEIYFQIPKGTDLADGCWASDTSPLLKKEIAEKGAVFVPATADDLVRADGIDDAKIFACIRSHNGTATEARWTSKARKVLKEARGFGSKLYASAAAIDETAPMMVESLFRDRGVSIIYGNFDEFKTTFALDMVAHVAAGADFQGRKVKPRPVVWYALEGAEEIPVKLRALETSLKAKDAPWGNDRLPITVLDRIPEDGRKWRAEVIEHKAQWAEVINARDTLKEFPTEKQRGADGEEYDSIRYGGYVDCDDEGERPIIVIDTLSIALGGEDEKGPKAVGFIGKCLDLLKELPWDEDEDENDPEGMEWPAAAHVIILHHQTKTGDEFAGHRAIAADTQGLYRVHRFGKMTDVNRSYSGQLTPMRVKGIPRPAPMRFEVEIVPVEGTKRTAAILKDKAAAIPEDLLPVIDAVRELGDQEEITLADLNECLDVVAAQGGKDGPAKRKARQRLRQRLEDASVLEGIEDDTGKVTRYSFHDIAR